MYFRHTDINVARPTVLFIHGLGESGLCFLEAFQALLLADFNIVVPDLLGFGRSSPAEDDDYAFARQIERMCSVLDKLDIDRVHIVGHSMGGDIGTQFCREQAERVLSFVNVEGDLTPADRFITEQAIESKKDGRFEEWLETDFRQQMVVEWCHEWPSTVRYLASLHMCRSSAFLSSACEVYHLNEKYSDSGIALIGQWYVELDVPRVFCWGKESLSELSQHILCEYDLTQKAFVGSFHWVMLDQTVQFYNYLSGFLTRNE